MVIKKEDLEKLVHSEFNATINGTKIRGIVVDEGIGYGLMVTCAADRGLLMKTIMFEGNDLVLKSPYYKPMDEKH